MDPIERLITKIISGLVATGAIVKTTCGYVLQYGVSALIGFVIDCLWELLLHAGSRIINSIREMRPEDSVTAVIFREIVAMGSEAADIIIEALMAVIAALRRLFNRGANFTERLGQRSLDFTSGSSFRTNE